MKFALAIALVGLAQALNLEVTTPTSTNNQFINLREKGLNLLKTNGKDNIVNFKTENVEDCPYKEEQLQPQDGGSSYVGSVFVGYKNFKCLWDTGSFDLQMISKKCSNCENTTALYTHEDSPTHELLQMDKSIVEIEYGSGPATIQKGFDRVGLYNKDGLEGRCMAKHTPVGEILKTSIKELKTPDRRFEAVCGIAPGPKEKEDQRLIKKLGIDRVGFCFNQDPKKPGLARWNIDTSSHGFKYSTNANMGYYWAIRVNNFRFALEGKEESIGCGKGSACLGLMDTGTSLHSVDNTTLDYVYKKLNEIPNLSCEDKVLKKLPSLMYTDDSGNHLVIDPEDYLVQVDDTKMRQKLGRTFDFHDIPKSIKSNLHFTPENFPQLLQRTDPTQKQCVLALADSGEKGMHIFGMPFFRHNQVVLDIKQRLVSWGKHDGNCNAAKQSLLESETRAPKLKVVDPTELRLSSASNRMKEAKVKGPRFVNQVKRELGFLQL